MNDFTKEELEELQYLAHFYIQINSIVHDEAIKIKNKIKSMIDNYCEHKKYSATILLNDSNGKIVILCDDCGKKLI